MVLNGVAMATTVAYSTQHQYIALESSNLIHTYTNGKSLGFLTVDTTKNINEFFVWIFNQSGLISYQKFKADKRSIDGSHIDTVVNMPKVVKNKGTYYIIFQEPGINGKFDINKENMQSNKSWKMSDGLQLYKLVLNEIANNAIDDSGTTWTFAVK